MPCDYLDLISNSRIYALNGDPNMDVVCTSYSGFGHPPTDNITETGPRQDGSTFLLYKVSDRVIQLGFTSIAKKITRHYENRDRVLNLFRANNGLSTLRATTPNGVRSINVRYNGGISNDFDKMADDLTYRFVVDLVAHDPIWFDPTEKTVTYTYTHTYAHLIFPFSFHGTDMAFSSGYVGLSGTATVNYLGNWMSFPKIEITGPINAPVVTNVTLGKSIALNYNIASGEVVTIDTGFNIKSITSSLYPDVIISTTVNSDLTGFRIEVPPIITTPTNIFKLYGTYAKSGVTKMDVKYYDRFIGV